MKQIGLIGGIGPESTIDYYRGIISGVRARTGTNEYPRILVNSINMTGMNRHSARRDWDGLRDFILPEIRRLEAAGAELCALCSNTPHLAFPGISAGAPMPMVSILDATVAEIEKQGYERVLVFGTAFTMANGLYNKPLAAKGISSFVPEEAAQEDIQRIIFEELEDKIVLPKSKARFIQIAMEMVQTQGCDSLVLGCTELPYILQDGDLPIPLLNTTQLHIVAILEAMFAGE